MKCYFDYETEELVTREVALSRMANAIPDDDIMRYIGDYLSWSDLRTHLSDDFVDKLIYQMATDWLFDRFSEYDLIESE